MIPTLKKGLGLSFVNTNDKHFNEIVYKGDTVVLVNKQCVLVHFKGDEFPTNNNFNCTVEISDDFKHIRLKQGENQTTIWENGKEKIKE